MKKYPRTLLFAALVLMSIALTACTGAPLESWPGITVAPDGNSVFVSNSTQIYQVDLTNHTETWRHPAEPDAKVHYYAAPAVAEDGSLFVGAYNFVFYSLAPGSAAGANPKWTFTGAKDRFVASPLALNGKVYAPSADGRLFALNQGDGSLAWEFSARHMLWSKPVSDGENLYLASMDHHVYALNPEDGSQVWQSADLGGPVVAAPAISEAGVLYTAIFGSKTDDPTLTSKLFALSAESGETLWDLPLNGWAWASPLLFEETLYFGDTAGYFYAVNAQDGKLVWQYPQTGEPKANSSILGTPAIIGDNVYFGSEAGTITIVNRANGLTPQEIPVGGKIYSDLVPVGDLILFAPMNLEDAILAALNPNGTIAWKFLPAEQ